MYMVAYTTRFNQKTSTIYFDHLSDLFHFREIENKPYIQTITYYQKVAGMWQVYDPEWLWN